MADPHLQFQRLPGEQSGAVFASAASRQRTAAEDIHFLAMVEPLTKAASDHAKVDDSDWPILHGERCAGDDEAGVTMLRTLSPPTLPIRTFGGMAARLPMLRCQRPVAATRAHLEIIGFGWAMPSGSQRFREIA